MTTEAMDTVRLNALTKPGKRYTAGVSFKDIDLDRYVILTTKVVGPTRFTLFSDKAQSAAFLLVEGPEGKASAEDVLALLKSQRIVLRDEFKPVLNLYFKNGYCVDGEIAALVIARGKEAVNGKDSWVEWHVEEPFDARAGVSDGNDQVDYRNRKNFVFVEKDQHILTVHSATRGVPGETFKGDEIPAVDGIWVRPLAGLGIKCDQSQKEMYADCEGVLQITPDNKLHVRLMLEVHDVDFKTGNIHFEGDVDVGGTVREGFEVHSKGAVTIVNDVERATVEGSEIAVSGAVLSSTMIARGQGIMIARAEKSTLRADGDVVGTSDVVGLTIHCGGACRFEGKTFVGGHISALGGIEIGWLGGKGTSKTLVEIDLERCDLPASDEAREKVEELDTQHKKLFAALGPIINNRAALNDMAPSQREAVQKLLSKFDGLEFEIDVAKSALRRARSEAAPEITRSVKITRGISAGVTIKIGEVSLNIDEEQSGACTYRLAEDGKSIQRHDEI